MRARIILPSIENLWKDEGFTIALNYQNEPARYLVSDAGGAIFDGCPTEAETVDFVRERWDALSEPGAYFGGWTDGTRYYLDVTRGYMSLPIAMDVARANGQLAIYDSVRGKALGLFIA